MFLCSVSWSSSRDLVGLFQMHKSVYIQMCVSLALSLYSALNPALFFVLGFYSASPTLCLSFPLSLSLTQCLFYSSNIFQTLSWLFLLPFFYVPYKKGSGHTERVVEQICLPIILSQLSLLFSVLCVIYKCTAPSLDVFYSVEYSSCVCVHSLSVG